MTKATKAATSASHASQNLRAGMGANATSGKGPGSRCEAGSRLEIAIMKLTQARWSVTIEEQRLRSLLASVAEGSTDIDAALGELRHLPYEDIGFAKVDHHRSLRDWVPEVILGEGKTPEQITRIAQALLDHSDRLLVT